MSNRERGTLLETMLLPRGLKTYTIAVTQGLCNTGIEFWTAYRVIMIEMLTKLSLCILSTLVLNTFLMALAARENGLGK